MVWFLYQTYLHLCLILGVDAIPWSYHGWSILSTKKLVQVWCTSTLLGICGLIFEIGFLEKIFQDCNFRKKFLIFHKDHFWWVLISLNSRLSGMNVPTINLLILVLMVLSNLKRKLSRCSMYFAFLWDWIIAMEMWLVRSC